MKVIVLYLLCWVAQATPALRQVTRVKSITNWTVFTTKHSRLDEELARFLVFTHEADDPTMAHSLFKVPLLVTSKRLGIGVYKFGLNSAHAGYNVVFQYRDRLVFSSARMSGPLSTQLRHFLTQYPAVFSATAQRSIQSQLTNIVEHNQTAGETDLPIRH
jgi:hypothetical protein